MLQDSWVTNPYILLLNVEIYLYTNFVVNMILLKINDGSDIVLFIGVT